jgi:hypothetical protein
MCGLLEMRSLKSPYICCIALSNSQSAHAAMHAVMCMHAKAGQGQSKQVPDDQAHTLKEITGDRRQRYAAQLALAAR